jgi:hypothetical protein
MEGYLVVTDIGNAGELAALEVMTERTEVVLAGHESFQFFEGFALFRRNGAPRLLQSENTRSLQCTQNGHHCIVVVHLTAFLSKR